MDASSSLSSSGPVPSANAPVTSSSGPSGQAKRAVPKVRARKGKIDIDDQIAEANRLAEMLKKVQSCCRALKKTGQKSKKRLVAKASRLSPEDLSRIASLKRFGLFSSLVEGGEDMEHDGQAMMKLQKTSPTRTVRDAISKHLGDIFSTHGVQMTTSGHADMSSMDGLGFSGAQIARDNGEVLLLGSAARLPPAQIRSGTVSSSGPADVDVEKTNDQQEVQKEIG